MDVEQQVIYWRTGSDEDWDMAEIALEKGKIRHGLFFLEIWGHHTYFPYGYKFNRYGAP